MAPTQTKSKSKGKPTNKPFARELPVNELSLSAPFEWIKLGWDDYKHAPKISMIAGGLFCLFPIASIYLTYVYSYITILPSFIILALVGPIFSHVFYDIAWEFEKGHKPCVEHFMKEFHRNAVQSFGFIVFLVIMIIFWTRIAALIHALYPETLPTLENMLPFLLTGTAFGIGLSIFIFCMSAFTPQILMERHVDLVTALYSSSMAVLNNKGPMLVWVTILALGTILSFATLGLGFVLFMPLFSYASWHAYIATIATKRPRKYK
ncbi:MAG: DUF2189 domain-containing protein [Shewanellaceae bacterium]|nr:DUF2189 domain-containing protein [Shewanellaceae bacterium]